jgi:hypothetical protein
VAGSLAVAESHAVASTPVAAVTYAAARDKAPTRTQPQHRRPESESGRRAAATVQVAATTSDSDVSSVAALCLSVIART